jgi:hypothetical protein
MKADKKIWIALNDQQVGLIMTTLARIQLFFSSSDEEYQGEASQVSSNSQCLILNIPACHQLCSRTRCAYGNRRAQERFNESVKSFVSDQVKTFRSDWQLTIKDSVALLVETPGTTRCLKPRAVCCLWCTTLAHPRGDYFVRLCADTPECLPLAVETLLFKARGKQEKQTIDIAGNVALYSYMSEQSSATQQVCHHLNMRVRLLRPNCSPTTPCS